MSRLVQFLVPVLAAIIAVAYEFALIAPADAFFGAVVTATILVAAQFAGREGAPLTSVAGAVLTDPKSHATPIAYWVFIGGLALSAVVALRVVVGL